MLQLLILFYLHASKLFLGRPEGVRIWDDMSFPFFFFSFFSVFIYSFLKAKRAVNHDAFLGFSST